MVYSPLDMDRVLKETSVARVEHHPALSSTNDRARECAEEGAGALPLLVVADVQTAGRGRGGHRWWTGRGSLAFSVLLDPGQAAIWRGGQSPLVALAAAVAVVEAVAPLVGSHGVGINWPNDVVARVPACGWRKLAGVLVEVLPDGRHIVGIGVNTNNRLAEAPPEVRLVATTLRELTGLTHDQTTILVTLLQRLEARLGQLAAEPGRIGTSADALCLQRGRLLTLDRGGELVSGHCAGIAPDGALLLDTPHGREAFYWGMLKQRSPDGY
jgi:BirA family biotin operon repressor/biotin-[acetyl-CoA-carboxylase] ligase